MKYKNKISASKRALLDMAKKGGLKSFMNGGSPVDALIKAQLGAEVSMDSKEGKNRMKNFTYGDNLKTSQDSAAYKAGYMSGKNITGYGRAGVTQNKNFKRGESASKSSKTKK